MPMKLTNEGDWMMFSKERVKQGLKLKEAIKEVIGIMIEGEKTHKEDEWIRLSISDHIKHASDHLSMASLVQITTDNSDHIREDLSHAATRCLMALQLFVGSEDEE